MVVGGGIAGATLARLAAFNGLRVTLLERGDYASATSGRSSKMAHGGLRYLEMGDIAQVREGVRSRDDLFISAPHLVRPHPFLIPVKAGDAWGRIKYRLGLAVYDFLAHSAPNRRHRWLSLRELSASPLATAQQSLAGAYQFYDGLMDDARLVLENIIAARQEGATCLNYAEFLSYTILRDRRVTVTWRDRLSG
ncbi:MAG: FAD-dependent oxidoreductase, partial [Proteobacteria bacterium]|nr:FAD-dependent oxidoreductase [Pseudomonadota bacterium]